MRRPTAPVPRRQGHVRRALTAAKLEPRRRQPRRRQPAAAATPRRTARNGAADGSGRRRCRHASPAPAGRRRSRDGVPGAGAHSRRSFGVAASAAVAAADPEVPRSACTPCRARRGRTTGTAVGASGAPLDDLPGSRPRRDRRRSVARVDHVYAVPAAAPRPAADLHVHKRAGRAAESGAARRDPPYRTGRRALGQGAVLHRARVETSARPRSRATVEPGVRHAERHVPAGGAEGPARLSAGPASINLIWDANSEPDLAGYLVLRGEAPGDTLQPLTPAPIAATNFEDRRPGPACGTCTRSSRSTRRRRPTAARRPPGRRDRAMTTFCTADRHA